MLNASVYCIKKFLEKYGFIINRYKPEKESQIYQAALCTMNNATIQFRSAHITSKKIGQFATLWKRDATGSIVPFDSDDGIDFCMIAVFYHFQAGLFIFPKSVLIKHDLISQQGKGGKRAIRVYPAWDIVTSKKALSTQKWQSAYFFKINGTDSTTDIDRLHTLLEGFKS